MGATRGALHVLLTGCVLVAWMFVSSYLILLNRHLMVDLKFGYPMFLSGMGMVASGLLSFICVQFKLVECKAGLMTASLWTTKILPVGFFTAVTLWTGNEVYLYLSVAFIQMFKAFTPVITMLCLFFAGLEEPTTKMIWSVILTAGGTALAAYGEVNLSFLGLVISVASAVSESVRLVMTQYLLTGLKFHPIEGLMYSAPACCLWLYAGAAVREMPQMLDSGAFGIMMAHPWKFTAAAVMGFLVNVLAYISIKMASSLTLKVLGTVKNTLLVLSSVMFMGEVVTAVQAIGYTVSLAGFGWYNQIKMQQIAKEAEVSKERGGLKVDVAGNSLERGPASLKSPPGSALSTTASLGRSSTPGDVEANLNQPLIDSRSSSDSFSNSVTINAANPVFGGSTNFGAVSISGTTVYGSQGVPGAFGSVTSATVRR